MTQCKFLSRVPRGKKGQVLLSKRKVVLVKEEEERLFRLKNHLKES